MKKILSLLLVAVVCTGFTACGRNTTPTVVKVETTDKVKAETPKVYKQGEEAFIIDDNGGEMYSIKINSVKVANDFEYKSDFSVAKEIIEVDYTYKNISKADENKLSIHSADLQISDITGAVAESSDMFPKQKPQSITVGTNCTVQGYYGLANKSDKVKISFSSESYKKSGILIFELAVK